MIKNKSLGFIFFGEEILLQRCIELTLSQGCFVAAVITNSLRIKQWATLKNIPVYSDENYISKVSVINFDVLVSITYPNEIPFDVFSKAKIMSLNYHNGPIPKYMGSNAPTWAIHNSEVQHSIVWHEIKNKSDTVAILETETYQLDINETSLSINIKNSSLALASFERLLIKILEGNVERVTIDSISTETFYSSYQRPNNFGVIDWNESQESIISLVNSCYFGHFANTFAVCKIDINWPYYFCKVRSVSLNNNRTPGEVVSKSYGSIIVACDNGLVEISDFFHLTGKPYLGEINRFNVGDKLCSSVEYDKSFNEKIAKEEPSYREKLLSRNKFNLPYAYQKHNHLKVDVDIDNNFKSKFNKDYNTALYLLLNIVISNLIRKDVFTITSKFSNENCCILCTEIPTEIILDNELCFKDNLNKFNKKIDSIKDSTPFLWDLISRDPDLRKDEELSNGIISEVCICFNTQPSKSARVSLVINGDQTYLYSNGSVSENELVTLGSLLTSLSFNIQNEDNLISKLHVVDKFQEEMILYQRNQTSHHYDRELRLTDSFVKTVETEPQKCAVVIGNKKYSYIELHYSSNIIANRLIELNVIPGQYVGMLVKRNYSLVATMLGISKSGAAYIPIDTSLPNKRINFILDDSNCKTVICSRTMLDKLPTNIRKIVVEDLLYNNNSIENCTNKAKSTDECYAIYTSGSTGTPKGVVLTHRAVINTIDWINREFQVTNRDTLLFVTSPSFDLSVYDVFGTLSVGATIKLADEELLQEPERIVETLVDGEVTIWNSAPPALVRIEPLFPSYASHSKLRLVMLSGDWIPVSIPTKLQTVFPKVRVKSLGGATEAAIWSNYYHINEVSKEWLSIPYGYPIQNAQYYILDHHLRPVPDNIPGDLYIGGDCLAKCYLNKLELTSQKFINNPYIKGNIIYKTGDLARYWADGTIEFLGRTDTQVKIRGYRIELGEIEMITNEIKEVRLCHCIVIDDVSGSKLLVLYVVLGAGYQEEVENVLEKIKSNLISKIPTYMIPDHVLAINNVPITLNGKLDYSALPKPNLTSTEYIAPSTNSEEKLQALWNKMFKRAKISVVDNFFEVGGDSLIAVSLVTQIKKEFRFELPLSELILKPTIKELADYIDNRFQKNLSDKQLNTRYVVLKRGGQKKFFFIYDGDGEVLLYKTLAELMPSDVTVYGILPKSKNNVLQSASTIKGMATDCIEIITQIQQDGPYNLGGLCAGGVISYEIARQLIKKQYDLGNILIFDAAHPQSEKTENYELNKRLKRFKSAIDHASIFQKPCIFVNRFVNFLKYMTGRGITLFKNQIKFRIYDLVSNNIIKWPNYIEQLSIRDIYLRASDKYNSDASISGKVILIKSICTDYSASDEPMSTQYKGVFLGWEKYVTSSIKLLETRGGHSSMFQTPYVKPLALQLLKIASKNMGQ